MAHRFATAEINGAGTGTSNPSSSGHSRSICRPLFGAALSTTTWMTHHCHDHDGGRTSEGGLSCPAGIRCHESACHGGDSPGCPDWHCQRMNASSCCFPEPLPNLHSCHHFPVSLTLPESFREPRPRQKYSCHRFPVSLGLPQSACLLV